MGPIRVLVRQIGKGYIAESRAPQVLAVGMSAEEAAENARLMAVDVLRDLLHEPAPSTLIVRIEDGVRSAIAMQPLQKPFELARVGAEFGSIYFDSLGNTAPSRSL